MNVATNAARWRTVLREDLNFLLTNRIPRAALTRFMGWFSKIRHPWVARASVAVWNRFAELDLSEAKTQRFASLHDCFTRELKPGARPLDMSPDILVSPCDAIVGECGTVIDGIVMQAKGYPYRIEELFGSTERAAPFDGGCYVTLRLLSSMYHHFHAPHNGRLEHVTYFSGDTWNVNPIALKRVANLFCRNERALIRMRLSSGEPIALVAVAAILVASIRMRAPDVRHLRRPGPTEISCDESVARGQALGWFEHGSTIIVFAPAGTEPVAGIESGVRIRMGQALLRRRRLA